MGKVKMYIDNTVEKKDFIVRHYIIDGFLVFTLYYKEFSYLRVYCNNKLINNNTFNPEEHKETQEYIRFGSFVGARNYIFFELFEEECNARN